jgi:hypothetical protein
MITDLASSTASMRPEVGTVVISPSWICAGPASPLGLAFVPAPPRITDTTERFMASHMMSVRIAPLNPMSAPTSVSSGVLSRKPSATRAQPE